MIEPENIEYRKWRCHDCGTFYAVEVTLNRSMSSFCPHCSYDLSNKRYEEIQKLQRVIRGLRGALKRKTKGIKTGIYANLEEMDTGKQGIGRSCEGEAITVGY